MRPKTLTILSALTAVGVSAAAWAVHRDWSNWRKPEFGELVFPDLAAKLSAVEKIVVRRGTGPLTIVKTADGWILKESDDYPVRANTVQKTLLTMAQLRLLAPKTRVKARYPKLEVEEPKEKGSKSRRIRVFGPSGGLVADLIVGKHNPYLRAISEGGTYIRRPNSERSWLVSGELTVGSDAKSWLRDRIVNIPMARISRATIRHGNGDKIVVIRADGKFKVEKLPGGKKLISEYYPNDIGRALADLELVDARKRGSVTFPPAKTATGTFRTADGMVIEIKVAEIAGQNWLRVTKIRAASDAVADDAGKRRAKMDALRRRTLAWDYIVPEFEAIHLKKTAAEVWEDAKPGS